MNMTSLSVTYLVTRVLKDAPGPFHSAAQHTLGLRKLLTSEHIS